MEEQILQYAIGLEKARKCLQRKEIFIGTNKERGLKICDMSSETCYRISDDEARILQDNLSKQIDEICVKIKEL